MSSAILSDWPDFNVPGARDTAKLRDSAALSTFALVICETSSGRVKERDTVATETPDFFATSLILALIAISLSTSCSNPILRVEEFTLLHEGCYVTIPQGAEPSIRPQYEYRNIVLQSFA
jgi:hypothetical protein